MVTASRHSFKRKLGNTTWQNLSEDSLLVVMERAGAEDMDGDVVKGKFEAYCKNKCGMNVGK